MMGIFGMVYVKEKLFTVKKCIGGVFLIGMAVQIIFGLSWTAANLFSLQHFSESAELVEISSTLRADEYIGILYPLLIRLGMLLERGLFLPYYFWLYIIQLSAAFFAGCLFISGSGPCSRKWHDGVSLFGAGYLVSVPQLLQLHMAVLPQSLILSLFLAQLGVVLAQMRKKSLHKMRDFAVCCVLWAGMALLQPDYLWLGGVPVLCLFLMLCKRKASAGHLFGMAAVMVLAVLLISGVNSVTQEAGSRGKIQRTLGAAMISRLAWPYFEDNYFFWPEEVKQVMSPMDGREISVYADNVQRILGPKFEEAFGKEQANAYYWEMALRCFSDRTKMVSSEIKEDFVAYLFVPFVTGKQFSGGGLSYAGWNFDRMWENSKALTSMYVRYGSGSFFVGIIFAAIYLIVGSRKTVLEKRTEKKERISLKIFGLCAFCALTQAVWYTMSGAGMMDYKNVPVIIALWYLCQVWGFQKYYRDGEIAC